MLFIATSNFPQAIDPALSGRADFVWPVPLPDVTAREQILRHTIEGIAAAFPGAKRLLSANDLAKAVEASEALDGRRLRKAVALACSVRPEAHADPDEVTTADLLTAIDEMKAGDL